MHTPTSFQEITYQLSEGGLGLALLAERTRDPHTREVAARSRDLRAHMARELVHALAEEGVAIPPHDMVGGMVDRIWLRVRDTFHGLDHGGMVRACERSLKELLSHYDEAIASPSTTEVLKELMERHRDQLHREMAELRSLAAAR